jgi:hypothetical protein
VNQLKVFSCIHGIVAGEKAANWFDNMSEDSRLDVPINNIENI